MYFMNFRYIEKYGTSDGDDFDARMNYILDGFYELLVY